MNSKSIKIPITTLDGQYGVVDHLKGVFGMITIVVDKKPYHKIFDLNLDQDITQFKFLKNYQKENKQPWQTAIDCKIVMMKDAIIQIIPTELWDRTDWEDMHLDLEV